MLKVGHVVVLLLTMLKVGHVVVLLVRNAAGRSCSKDMLGGHVVVLLLRNVWSSSWSCSTFVVKKY